MKNLIVLLSIFIPSLLYSQTLEIIEVDTSNYPIVSAKFIALDASMNIIKDLTVDESDIIENGISQNIVKITNPSDSNMNQSVVLVVDVSGSMSGTNIDLAKNAIREFINLTPFTFTELAILSFDTDLYVNQDFTRNKNKLLNSLSRLNAGGGTSYDVALFSQKNSALNIVSKRPNSKPVVVFLTDGLCDVNYTKVASMANNMGAKIYSITLNMPMPHDLAEITTQTNATYFENVRTVDEAKRAYLSVLFQIYKLYGVVYWNAELSCDEVINFDFKTRGTMSASYFYEIDPKQTKGVFFSEKIVAFDSYAPAMNKDVLIGTNTTATITNIKVNDSVNFEIFYDFNLPALIEPGNTLPLKVYRPKTADQIYTEVEVATDVCPPKKFYIFQGNIATFVIPGDLKLYTPNGGEKYFSGQFTDIKWRNKTNNKFVNVYLSVNNGSSYTWLNQSAGDNYSWLVPGYQSDSCLIKVSLETKPMKLLDAGGQQNKILVSNDGGYFAYSTRKTLYFYSSSSGYYANSIYFKNRVLDFKFSPINDDALVNTGNKIYVYNSLKDKKYKIKHKKEKPLEYFYSDDGKSVYVFYKNNRFMYEFDASTGKRKKKINLGSNVKVVSINAGIASILTSDKRWLIWDLNQKQQIDEFYSNLGFVKTDVNFDGEFVVALDRKNQITYWSHYLVDTFLTVQHISNSKPDIVKFNPQNNSLLCYEKNKKITFYSGKDVVFEYV
ncbi:MAG: VWA domain-containing protein, partial [Bacteroidales bacterium]|nr:VWA domain-containing protein [Bacteroidales bacterium]